MAYGYKTGGRKKGTPNKATVEIRQAIAKFAEEGAPKLLQWLDEVEDPARRIELWSRVVEYHIPKLQRVERTISDSTDEELLEEVRRRKAAADAQKASVE